MAPSRRKGASRATAAAAARRFKVDDLVLAKVKGFSAWPAMVSEPEKWGYPADPKKVHVLFFGTQQIAFCNPNDVEVFTEEKKESLLGKCHGKSSDFVRAVQEIIHSYEKLKKKDLVNDVNSSEEVTLTNCRNPVKSPNIHDHEQTMEALASSPDAQRYASTFSAGKNETHLQELDTTPVDFFNGEEASTEEPADSVVAKATRIATYSSRKRSSGSRVKRLVAQGVTTSTDRSRSSSRLESRRLQRKLETTNSGGSSKDVVSNFNPDGLRRSSRKIRKLTVTFEGDDAQSLSNGSKEDNGYEIAAIDSYSISLGECTKTGHGCEPEQSEALDHFGGDFELSKGLDHQIKAIVRKKKRKPSRKRVTSSATVPAVKYGGVEDSEVGLHELEAPVSSCMKWDVGDSKEDGDEHLPLSKRARVRMGKQFSYDEGVHSSVQIGGNTEEAEVDKEQKHSPSYSDDNCLADECSPVLERASDGSKETTDLLNNRAQFWQVKNNQSSGCSLDAEAALPPSKRLNRALEAMSANASDEDRFFTESSSILKTKVPECSLMSMQQSPNRATKGEEGNGSGLKGEESPCNNVSQVGVTVSSSSQDWIVSREDTKLSMESTVDNQLDNDTMQNGMVSGCSIMSLQQSSNRAMEGEEGNGSALNSEKSPCNNVSQVGVTESSTCQGQIVSQENTNFSMEVAIDNQLDNDSKGRKIEVLAGKPQDGMEHMDCKILSQSSSDRSNEEAGTHSARHLSPHFDQAASNCCNADSPEKMQPSKVGAQTENTVLSDSRCEHVNKEHSVTGESDTSSLFVTAVEKAGLGPAPSVTTVSCYKAGATHCEKSEYGARHLSPHFNQVASNFCNADSPEKMQPSKVEAQTEYTVLSDSRCEHVNKEHSVSGESDTSSLSITAVEKAGQGPAPSVTTVSCYKAGATRCEKSESVKSQVNENSQVNGMFEMKDNKVSERREALNYLIISNDRMVDKETNGVHSILSPTGGQNSSVQISPRCDSLCHISTSESVADEGKVDSVSTLRPISLGKSNYVEAQAALSSFESMLGTLSRTKESIGRATRIAIDCAKFGTAAKVIEILMSHLENEHSLQRRVDLFFLVDSIAQFSRSLKGSVGGAYPSAIQVALPRLLSATAPPGSEAQENRRQCLKVLRLWSERRILPESIVRHHMRELDSIGGLTAVYSRRSLRTERALDDPVRDMGSMLVDEYGSNSSFQLLGLGSTCLQKDEADGSDSDGGSFEAVTPEHRFEMPEGENTVPLSGKRGHILEDVDGELEMEDVAPSCGDEINSTSDSAQLQAVQTWENHPAHSLPQHFTHSVPAEVASLSPRVPSLPSEAVVTAQLTSASMLTDCCHDGVDSKTAAPSHNMRGSSRQSVSQNSVSRHSHSFSNSGHYHTAEYNREAHTRTQLMESSSFNDLHSRTGNNGERGVSFHNKAQSLRPPNPQSSYCSYVHTEQHVKTRRETPRHCYSNRFHNGHMNPGNYYNSHERIKPGPYDHRGGWRGPAPRFPGPRYHDRKTAYAHNTYMDHPGEPMGIINDGWNIAPRPWNHRNSASFRPHPESSFPVSSRGFWQPR